MMMAILCINGSLQAQWGLPPGYVGENSNNLETTLFGTPDAFVVNTALIECTDPSLGLPPGHRATLAALVWADLSGDVYLWMEYAHRGITSSNNCLDFLFQDNATIQVNSADATHPDVIIRDHPGNPGVDYIISVIYTENDMITLNEYEVIGLPTININLINSIQLFTATYRPGEIPGSFPKIDGFVNPENQINDYYEMGGFAVVWQTNLGVELQVFDAISTPIYETLFPMIYQGSFIEKFTPDVAAIVERDPSSSSDFNQIVAISFNHAEYNSSFYDHGVLEMNITNGNIDMYNFSGVTLGSSNSRIDGMGIVNYPNARWATMSTNDCGNAIMFTNTSPLMGQNIPVYFSGTGIDHLAFQNYTITAGSGQNPGGNVEAGNIQYPFGLSSGRETDEKNLFLNSVEPNTGLAFDLGLLEHFCKVNSKSPTLPYNNCHNIDFPHAGQGFSMSTSSNSGYELFAAWIDVGNDIRYKYTCNADLLITSQGESPLIGTDNLPETFESIQAFPNPAQDYLHVELHQDITPYTLNMYDMYGRLILEKNIENQTLIGIELKEFMDGIYRIDVLDINGKRHGKTITISR